MFPGSIEETIIFPKHIGKFLCNPSILRLPLMIKSLAME